VLYFMAVLSSKLKFTNSNDLRLLCFSPEMSNFSQTYSCSSVEALLNLNQMHSGQGDTNNLCFVISCCVYMYRETDVDFCAEM